METEQNIISSEAKLLSIAGVMFFALFVKNNIKPDSGFTEEELKFIRGYLQVGYVNLIFLAIVLIASLSNLFLVNGILSRITTIGGIAIFIITVFSIFACANDLTMWNENESLTQKIQHKGLVLKAYTPILNFILRFRQENYNMPYRWLKESILLRTSFIFGTLLFGNSFGMGMLMIIFVRLILLMLNIDVIPLTMKKTINSMFSCNPGEIFAYVFTPIVAKLKKGDYDMILQARKQGYAQGQSLGVGIIIQYILFIGAIVLLYRNIDISLDNIILFIAMVLWIIRVVLFFIHKKTLLKIPILSEIISLIFH